MSFLDFFFILWKMSWIKFKPNHVYVIQKVSSKLTLPLQNDSNYMPPVNYPRQHMCFIWCGSMLGNKYEPKAVCLPYGNGYWPYLQLAASAWFCNSYVLGFISQGNFLSVEENTVFQIHALENYIFCSYVATYLSFRK